MFFTLRALEESENGFSLCGNVEKSENSIFYVKTVICRHVEFQYIQPKSKTSIAFAMTFAIVVITNAIDVLFLNRQVRAIQTIMNELFNAV